MSISFTTAPGVFGAGVINRSRGLLAGRAGRALCAAGADALWPELTGSAYCGLCPALPHRRPHARSSAGLVRNDLRVTDHHALAAAAAAAGAGRFLKAEAQWQAHGVGANRLAFLERNLRALAGALGALGISFTVLEAPRFRDAPGVLLPWAQARGAAALHFNDEYPLNERRRDAAVVRAFGEAGVPIHRYTDSVIARPGTLKTGQGAPYTVFTPFKRRWLAMWDQTTAAPLAAPDPQGAPQVLDPSLSASLGLTGTGDAAVPASLWPGGEKEAHRRLTQFLGEAVLRYDSQRDFPAVTGTSTLSPYLSLGVLSPRQVLAALLQAFPEALGGRGQAFGTELLARVLSSRGGG